MNYSVLSTSNEWHQIPPENAVLTHSFCHRANMIFANIVCLLLVICLPHANAEVVQDPFAHYLGQTAYSADDEVLSFFTKLGEGKDQEYLFVSLRSLVNGKAGNIWQIYAYANGNYDPLAQSISLRTDALALATISGVEGVALVTYWPHSAESGKLRAIQIDGSEVIESEIGEIQPTGKDQDLYSQLFLSEGSKVSFLAQPVQEVKAKFIPKTGITDDRTPEIPRERHSTEPPISSNPTVTLDRGIPQATPDEESAPVPKKIPWIGYGLVIAVSVCLWVTISRARMTR